MDCVSRGFGRKVQSLLHFEKSRVDKADVFKAMLAHTFRYRSRQLFEFMDTVIDPAFESRIAGVLEDAGADEPLLRFTRAQTEKVRSLVIEHESTMPPESTRNKTRLNFIETLRVRFDHRLVRRGEQLLRAIKARVKATFNHEFFYATEEVIEEARALRGGIVIPHPEQFWPILLAGYDADGYEVWNPQSREYTNFLIEVVTKQNKTLRSSQRPILIFMGDDCHMGEKVKEPALQDPEKAGRDVGYQPAWDEMPIRKSLAVANTDRNKVIEEYRSRLR